MICALTVRKLKPGMYEQFRDAWQPPPEAWTEGWQKAYHVRNLRDENEVVSFGFYDGTFEELQRENDELDPGGERRAERERLLAECVESVGADSVYEVIEEVTRP